MSKGNIRLGDKLTSGGEVTNVSSTTFVEGKKIALIGDLVSCPIQGHGINRIVSSEPFGLPLTEKLQREEDEEKLNQLKAEVQAWQHLHN